MYVGCTEPNQETDKRETGPWTHGQMDSCQKGGGWGKKGKGSAKQHACLTHGHGQRCGVDPAEGRWEQGGGDQRGGKWGHL